MKIRPMRIKDYDQVYDLWEKTSKNAMSAADEWKNIKYYLKRNKGISQVAIVDNKIVGVILCGHDGRRGYIHHLAVLKEYRRRNIGRKLVNTALAKLKEVNILKCHLFVFVFNEGGILFWTKMGFVKREDLMMYSYKIK